jgi:hypothetical protein
VLERGAYGTLTRDGAEAFLEALGFVLQQIGADSVMADVDHEAAVAALAQGYPGLAQEEQLALSRAREIWTAARSGWASAPQADRQAFAMAVLVLAFGEQAVRGATPGDGGLGDAGMPSVDEQTWTDTQNAMSCWAAAGCSGYDASTDTFDYGDPGGP